MRGLFGFVVEGAEVGFPGGCQLAVAASHDAPGSVCELVERYTSESGGGSPHLERGDECAGKSGAIDIAAYTGHCGRVEHGVDAGF